MLVLANSLLDGYFLSNTVGKGIVLLQLFGSVLMASIIIGKWRAVGYLRTASRRFDHDFNSSNNVLEYYLNRRPSNCVGLERIYKETCERLLHTLQSDARALISGIGQYGGSTPAALTAREIALVRGSCEQATEEEMMRAEKNMTGVATVVALSPMLGLLGTVWGVLDAFAEMGSAGSANLATIAPAISSALVTTVVGLIVAIPGVIFFNYLNSKIRELTNKMVAFSEEISGRIACEYQGGVA